jgi:proteasome lid subunit RPN8/RPN11
MTREIKTTAIEKDSGFTPIGIVEEPIRQKGRCEARSGYQVYGGATGFEVAIPETVVERIMMLGEREAPKEWYGLLVGRVYEGEVGRHVVILGVVPDPGADACHASVHTSFDSELQTRTSARLLYPDGVPVGWVHGHVRYGARYSAVDFRNQTTWTQPHAIGIVADPFTEPRLGVYRGPEGELLKPVLLPPAITPATAGTTSACLPEVTIAELLQGIPIARRGARQVWPWFVMLTSLVMLSAAALFIGRSAGRDDQIERIDRRVADLEQARARITTAQSTPDPKGKDDPASLPDGGASWPWCSQP